MGTVRNHDGGADVDALVYSCHPSAGGADRRRNARRRPKAPDADYPIKVDTRWPPSPPRRRPPDRRHRGRRRRLLPPRGEAFEACRKLIDDLKHEVPIWKHQTFSDGTEEWVGAC
ncbi:molybdopterin biosynthesis protein MoeE [Streptomyces narbonensis]